jgi:hypothetical protein
VSNEVVFRVLRELRLDATLRAERRDDRHGDARPPDFPWLVVMTFYSSDFQTSPRFMEIKLFMNKTTGIYFPSECELNYPS